MAELPEVDLAERKSAARPGNGERLRAFARGQLRAAALVRTSRLRLEPESCAVELRTVRHGSQNIGTNTRLRWTIKPGNDLFIVWNRGWQRIVTDPHVSIVPESDFIGIKLRWTFRL